jgi:hypothetical protein
MKELSKSEKAAIKRIAKNIYNTSYKKVESLKAKIQKLQEEMEAEMEMVKKLDTTPIITESTYGAMDLVERKVVESLDGKGNKVRIVSFEFKYPDTIYPVANDQVELTQEEAEAVTQQIEDTEEYNPVEVVEAAKAEVAENHISCSNGIGFAHVEPEEAPFFEPEVEAPQVEDKEEESAFDPFMA